MFVRRAIDHYLKGKRSRRDVTRFLETHPDLDRLAERIADEIREGRYRDTLIGKTELEAEKRKDETKMPSELRETYKTIGGVPFLDNQYTVYGEVVEGLDVVDAIQQVKTNKQDRPTENVVIKSVEVLE